MPVPVHIRYPRSHGARPSNPNLSRFGKISAALFFFPVAQKPIFGHAVRAPWCVIRVGMADPRRHGASDGQNFVSSTCEEASGFAAARSRLVGPALPALPAGWGWLVGPLFYAQCHSAGLGLWVAT